MSEHHRLETPAGIRVSVFDDFPSGWEVVLYRSDDGTPVVELSTDDHADHDPAGSPYVRMYINDQPVYEHLRPRTRRRAARRTPGSAPA